MSFDNRHIVGGVVAAVVVMGSVFVLGVVVGKQIASNQHAAHAPDLLTALDEKAALTQPVKEPREEPPLTFPSFLTRQTQSTDRPVPQLASAPSRAEKVSSPLVGERSRGEDGVRSLPAPKKGGGWGVQLLSSQSRAEADRVAALLKDKGYAPYVVQAELPNRGVWYRVRVGSFKSKEQAHRLMADLRQRTNLNAFVTEAR